MKQYLDLCKNILNNGTTRHNRTGVDTIGIHGAMLKFDMAHGFPVVTTKKLAWQSAFVEMLGHLRGYCSAAQFREIGTNVWNANANANPDWLCNPSRQGVDDLGKIYGVQARRWGTGMSNRVDQLQTIVDKLSHNIDDRRLIVSHWNPPELKLMALPPCHVLYQFGIADKKLNLTLYQRSADMPLGVPFNIAGYSWLLHVIAHVTGFIPGVFTHFIHDAHIYENQIEPMEIQVKREPLPLPVLAISDKLETFMDLDRYARIEDFNLKGYQHHPRIHYPFAV